MRFALEHQNPLIVGQIAGGDFYPPDTYSMLSISNPDLVLWAIKPADYGDDHSITIRLWNLSSKTAEFSLGLTANRISRAQHTTHIETPLAEMPVISGRMTASINGNQLKTFQIKAELIKMQLDAN